MADVCQNVDEYIAAFPKAVQNVLQQVRTTILQAAPDAEEVIKYAIPTYVLHGNLVHFGAFKNHIGFYALPSGSKQFSQELSVYKVGKGSVQFPLSKPMPLQLIAKMVRFRVKENKEKQALRKKLTTS